MSDKPIEERVSILEEKVFTQGRQDGETVALVKDLSTKLVWHIQEEGIRDAKIATKVDYIENTVKESSDNIRALTNMATDSKEDLLQYRAIIKTIAKIAAIGVFVVSSAWGVVEYMDKHGTKISIVQQN